MATTTYSGIYSKTYGPYVGSGSTTPPTGDTTRPAISITVPVAGATLTVGQQVVLTAPATDNVAVAGVDFTNGATGASLGSGTKNGNTYTLLYTPTATGALTISATARDAAGNSQTASVTVNVQAASGGGTGGYASQDYFSEDYNQNQNS